MGYQGSEVYLAVGQEGNGSRHIGSALAADREYILVVQGHVFKIDGNRLVGDAQKEHLAVALEGLDGQVEAGLGARDFDHIIQADAVGFPHDNLVRVLLGGGDEPVGAQRLAHRQTGSPGAGEEDAVGAQGLGGRHRCHAQGAGADDQDVLTCDVAAHGFVAIEGAAQVGHQGSDVEGYMIGNFMDGIYMIDHILGVAAGGCESVGPVAFLGVAIVEAGGVIAQAAVPAATAAVVGFYRHPVADGEFVHRIAQGDDNAGVFVTGDVDTVGRLSGEGFVDKSDIGAANGAGFNLDKHFLGAGLGNWNHLQFLMVRTHQNQGLHFFRQIHHILPIVYSEKDKLGLFYNYTRHMMLVKQRYQSANEYNCRTVQQQKTVIPFQSMKALVLKAYNEDLVMEDLPVPSPGPLEVLVKVHYCGICGTDLKIVGGKLPGIIHLPHTPGHEIAGEIVALGEEVKGLSVGDRGIVYLYTTCHDCELCRTGRENICYNLRRLGFELPGGFAEYVKLPAYNFCKVSPESKLEEMAVLTDAVATPYHALKSIAPLKEGQSVLIVGAGGLGLHAVQLAKLAGVRVVVTDVKKDALEAAGRFGADLLVNSAEVDPKKAVLDWTEGRGVDVVLEGVGRQSTVSWSLYCLKPGGTLVIMGYDPPNPITVNTKDMHYNEWKICGTRAATKQDLVELIALTEAGKLKPVVSTVLPFGKTNEGLAAVAQGKTLGRIVIKVM